MINEADIKAKTDGELLEIWANQNEYRSEIVEWVKTEIETRRLDTSGIHVRTAEDIKQDTEVSSSFAFVRILAILQVGTGLLLFLAGYSSLKEEGFVGPALLSAGILCIVFAIAVWRGKRWAFVLGFFLYTLNTLCGIVATAVALYSGFASFKSVGPGQVIWTLVPVACMTIISGFIAVSFNTLRKKGAAA